MNASEKDRCKRCGAEVPATSAGGLCPACLLSGAIEPTGGVTRTVSMVTGGLPELAGPSRFPCDFGSYRLLGVLGRGGMGTVYEAEQLTTGRRLALKVLGYQLDSPEMRKRFLREGRLAARVSHPNSLYVFGSEEIEGVPAITMEIAGCGTLKDKLKQRGALPMTEAVDAVLDILSGLESAYTQGVLHRDIKPSNCFVCPDGSVKIGDFGLSISILAKTDTFVTSRGKIMGTPAYASPEQLRGDALDLRADIYSVGATLFTLLTGRAPFEGDNAVQVVANAVNRKPRPLAEYRKGVPPELERVVMRCLAKEPDERYADYASLRNALLPFSSREPEPASIPARLSAGWIDYLIAFLPVYVVLMFMVGARELLVRPLAERTLYSARYYFLLLGMGVLYFTIAEGIWGAGVGKWLRGLRVVRSGGDPPGFGRALIRALIPVACVEGVRMPLTMSFISDASWSGLQIAGYVIAANACGWIPFLLTLRARRENGFATVWDLVSETRVVVKPKGAVRPSMGVATPPKLQSPAAGPESLGPYKITGRVVPGEWLSGADPVLRRQVWLRRPPQSEFSIARRNVTRAGRLRWLQKVTDGETTWDAFEAVQGVPFATVAGEGKRVPWSTLRHWLHDLASELWAAAGDRTLPAELSLDHVWISSDGRAILLDEPWPDVASPAERIPVLDVAGQQRFLDSVAACVESTTVPLHAKPVLKNLRAGKFERLSFLAGTLRGLLDKPAEVGRGLRAGSIFMLPLYVLIAVFVGRYHDRPWDSLGGSAVLSALAVLGCIALVQLLAVPFRNTASYSIFRLAVINAKGEPASRSRLLVRWIIVWLPLLLPTAVLMELHGSAPGVASIVALLLLILWVSTTAFAVFHPHRGLHDRLAGTWVVRR